jgi:hypothetical protein
VGSAPWLIVGSRVKATLLGHTSKSLGGRDSLCCRGQFARSAHASQRAFFLSLCFSGDHDMDLDQLVLCSPCMYSMQPQPPYVDIFANICVLSPEP